MNIILREERYFSFKHHGYGYKTEVYVNSRGLAQFIISGIPGAEHDITLARRSVEWLGESNYVIADSGYQGLQ